MKMILLLFALLLAVVAGIAFSQNYFKNGNIGIFNSGIFQFEKSPTATINNKTFKLLVAKSDKDKEIGLSEKTSIPDDTAMLFPFGKADYHSFWMKNMKFPIDIIYINKNRIVTVYQNAQPPKDKEESPPIFKPEESADTVLEINAGLSKKYNFKKGDTVKIENL